MTDANTVPKPTDVATPKAPEGPTDSQVLGAVVMCIASVAFFLTAMHLAEYHLNRFLTILGPLSVQCIGYPLAFFACDRLRRIPNERFRTRRVVYKFAFPLIVIINACFSYTIFVYLGMDRIWGGYVFTTMSILLMACATVVYHHKFYGYLTAIAILGFMGFELSHGHLMKTLGMSTGAVLWFNTLFAVTLMLLSSNLRLLSPQYGLLFREGLFNVSYINFLTSALVISSRAYWGECSPQWFGSQVFMGAVTYSRIQSEGFKVPTTKHGLVSTLAIVFYILQTAAAAGLGEVGNSWLALLCFAFVMVVGDTTYHGKPVWSRYGPASQATLDEYVQKVI